MLKNVLIVVVLLVVFNAAFVFLGGLDILVKTEQKQDTTAQNSSNLTPDLVDVFRNTLEEEVEKQEGESVDSFEPQMFLKAFPGLVETDFANVSSRIGYYTVVDGRIVHELGEPRVPIHSEAKAINRAGYETLLKNVSQRAGIDLRGDGTITDIVDMITAD